MAKFDIRSLNCITSGTKQNTFNIEFCYTDDGMIQSKEKPDVIKHKIKFTKTFFGDVGKEESMNQKFATNEAAFYDINNKFIIHPLYNMTRSKIRSTATKQNLAKENVDLYLPIVSSDIIGICQNQNYAYALTEETDQDPIKLSVIYNSSTKVDNSYHYVLSNDHIDAHLYPTISDLTNDRSMSCYQQYALSDDISLSSSRLSNVFSIIRNLNGIRCNYLVEIPECTIWNRYTDGYIQADMAVTKTFHDYVYNMEISSGNYDLNNCREYCNIGICGNKMYLTYRDNVQYENKYKYITYYDNLNDSEYDQVHQTVIEHYLERKQARDTYSYQHVEVVNSINHFDDRGRGRHKSSLFSVILNNTGLNNSTIPEVVKMKLRKDISNNVRKIASKICPAHTQLFNVYFEGD